MILGYKNIRQLAQVYGVILAMAVLSFIIRIVKFREFGLERQIVLFFFSIVIVSFFWESLRFINIFLNKKLPFERNITQRMVVQLLLGIIIGLSVRFVIYFFGEPYIPFKLDSLFLATTWILYAAIPIGVNLGFFTLHFIGRWKVSIIKAERLEREKSQVQFDNLKNQLNPHFLFNALTSLNSLIFEDQALASQFLQHLSRVYRYVLQNKDKASVTLKTELDFIQNYVFLLETRFKDALTISFKIEKEMLERTIVPVTLQILVENALKHNIVDKDKPLTIDIVTVGDYLVVSNNLQVRKRVETSNKLGLGNLKSLYHYLTERPVVVEDAEKRFSVKVPLM